MPVVRVIFVTVFMMDHIYITVNFRASCSGYSGFVGLYMFIKRDISSIFVFVCFHVVPQNSCFHRGHGRGQLESHHVVSRHQPEVQKMSCGILAEVEPKQPRYPVVRFLHESTELHVISLYPQGGPHPPVLGKHPDVLSMPQTAPPAGINGRLPAIFRGQW